MAVLRGILWPFGRGPDGFPQMNEGVSVVRDSLISIVTTQLGERRMRPEYGLNSFGYVFESLTPIDVARISRDVRRAIVQSEPRVDLVSVNVGEYPDPGTKGILIHVVYVVNSEYGEARIPLAA